MNDTLSVGEKIRVMVVDDVPLFRAGARMFLQDRDDMEIVGEASNGEQAVRMYLELLPDVVLMDIQMPELDGPGATAAILAAKKHRTAVIGVTVSVDPGDIRRMIQAGAKGYLLKDAGPEELVTAIQDAYTGKVMHFDSAVQEVLIETIETMGARRSDMMTLDNLTPRERVVLGFVKRGLANKEIAREMDLSVATVKVHVSEILRKLDVPSRSAAAAIAERMDLG
ncbi:MAG: response regulator [Candidatus Dormibacteria bacterium]